MTERTPTPGADHPRRVRDALGTVVAVVVTAVAAWLLWPTSLGGCTTLTIVSGASMEPTYASGDLVVARCGTPAVGDVVVYTPPDVGGARVIHRIVGGDGDTGWVASGDGNDFLDPWTPTDDDVLGRAVLHVPGAGNVAAIALSPITWLSVLLVAGALALWPGGRPDESTALAPADGEPTAQGPTAQGPTAQDPTVQDPNAQDPNAQDPTARDLEDVR